MDTDQISLLLGVCSAITGAFTNILAKRVMNFSRTKDFLSLNFLVIFFILALFSPMYFEFKFSWLSLAITLLVSFIDAFGNFLYFKSFEVCDTITASSLISLSPVFSLIVLLIFQGSQSLPFPKILAVILTIAGIFLLNRQIQEPFQGNSSPTTNENPLKFLIPLGAAFTFGITIFPIKYLFSSGVTNPASFYLVRAAIISITTYLFIRPQFSWLNHRTFFFTAGRAALVLVQFLLLYYAINAGNPAIVKAASNSSPFFVLFLSGLVFHEEITRGKVFGSLLIITGLILLAIIQT